MIDRPIRNDLLAHRRFFAPEWQKPADVLEECVHHALTLATARYNQTTRALATFSIGAHVLVEHPSTKRWDTPAIVVEVGPNRDYIVNTAVGRLFRRNRLLLFQRVAVMPDTTQLAAQAAPAQPSFPPVPDPEQAPQQRRQRHPKS